MVEVFIPRVCERDTSLLVLEEMHASIPFQHWFLSKIGEDPGSARLDDAQFSLVSSDGESDVVASFHLGHTRLTCLIENKIDASLQHRQAERYLERAADLLQSGKADNAITIILAPEKYLGKEPEAKGFNRHICYEDLADWFLHEKPLSARSRYKAAILNAAITKARRMPDPDPRITSFWHDYWELARKEGHELQMQDPGPRRGGFMYFHPTPLPSSIYLVHKLRFGKVDLQFYGLGKNTAELHRVIGHKLRGTYSLMRAGESAVIRIEVPALKTKDSFSKQASEVRKGLAALLELYRWYCFELPDEIRKSIADLGASEQKSEVRAAASDSN